MAELIIDFFRSRLRIIRYGKERLSPTQPYFARHICRVYPDFFFSRALLHKNGAFQSSSPISSRLAKPQGAYGGMGIRPFESLPPTETLEIENGLKLVPRVKLNVTVYPSSPSMTKPLDEWKLKHALIDFLDVSLSVSVTVPEEDIVIKRLGDVRKRKREDPLAHGAIIVRDLGFVKNSRGKTEQDEEDVKVLENKFLDRRKYLVDKMDGIELNLEGSKFKLTVSLPECDNFDGMKNAWEEYYVFGNRGLGEENLILSS